MYIVIQAFTDLEFESSSLIWVGFSSVLSLSERTGFMTSSVQAHLKLVDYCWKPYNTFCWQNIGLYIANSIK